MMTIIYTVIISFCLLLNRMIFKNFFNYLNIFLIIWYTAAVLSMKGFYNFTIPSMKTYIYILIVLVFLEVFSIIFLRITIKRDNNEKKIKCNYCLKYKITYILSACVTIIMIPTTIKGCNILLKYGFGYLRNIGFTLELYTSYEKIFLVYIAKPLNIALLIYSIIDLIDNKKIKINFILCLLNVIQYILTFGGRAALLEIVLLTGIAIIDKYNANIYIAIKNNKKVILFSAIFLVFIVYITSQRSLNKNAGFLFNFYSYYVGSIHLFGINLDNPSMSLLDGRHLLYGKEMFNSIIEFINIFGSVFRISLPTGIEQVNQVTQQYRYVSPNVQMNNNVTMIYAFLRDFDLYGLIIGPCVIALIYAITYKTNKKEGRIQDRAVYYYLLSQLPYFLFEFVLAKGSIVFTIGAILLLSRIILKKQIQNI